MNKNEVYICIYDGNYVGNYVGTGPTPAAAHNALQEVLVGFAQAAAPVSECVFYKGCKIEVKVKLEEVIGGEKS